MINFMGRLRSANGRPRLPDTQGSVRRLRWPRSSWGFCIALAAVALTLHVIASCTWRQNVSFSGGCQPSGSMAASNVRNQNFVVTYCGASTSRSPLIASFPSGTRRIILQISNYGSADGKSMELVGGSGEIKPLVMPSTSDSATRETIFVPHSIRHGRFDLRIHDRSPSRGSWVGATVVGYSALYVNLDALAVATLIVLLLHFLLFELGALVLRFHKGRQAPNLAVIALGLISFAAFWLYYASRTAGIALSLCFLLALVAHAAWRTFGTVRDRRNIELHVLQATLAPVATLALLLLIIGFYPFPEHWSFWQYVANRWLSLPIDNWLPKIFADQIWNGHVRHPMVGNWLSSDRPPLQAGFYLLLRPLLPMDRGTLYQVGTIYLQATILIPLAGIISHLRLERVRGLTLLLISTSALVIYNGTFVWPKLIAATFCLVSYGALFSSSHDNSSQLFNICVAAAAAALAMLSHGGAIFALLSIFAVYFALGGWRQWRALAVGAILSATIYVPWMLYQHLIDPPGTRLIAWMLAGQIQPASTPILKALYYAYAHLTLDQWWQARVANIATICHGMLAFFSAMATFVSDPVSLRDTVVVNSFFYFFFAQWFFSPIVAGVAFGLGWKRMRSQLREILTLAAVVCGGLAIWCVLMYGPSTTIIHAGAYFLNLASLLVCILCVYRFNRLLFVGVGLANLVVFVAAFVLRQRTLTGSNPPLPADLLNADRLPTGSGLYALLVALALVAHYFACRAKRNQQFDAQAASETVTQYPGKQVC